MGNASKFDYSVTFRDMQDLELIRRKLLKASMILKSSANVGRSLSVFVEELRPGFGQVEYARQAKAFEQYTSDLRMHERVVNVLIERSTGTSKLVC